MKHCMLDLETLGLGPGCAILSIGAQMFTPRGLLDETFKVNVTRESCEEMNLFVDPDTEKWWEAQSEEARAALHDPAPIHLRDALDEFHDWYKTCGAERVWSHGQSADIVWLEAAYRASLVQDITAKSVPWGYRDGRDTRTLFDVGDIFTRTEPRIPHCALEDARAQATDAQRAMDRVLYSMAHGASW